MERLSSLERVVGSTLDICKMVMPTQMTKKAITIVMICEAEALSPWNRTYTLDLIEVEEGYEKGDVPRS